MPSKDNEPLQNTPHIVPDRDDVASFQRHNKPGKAKAVDGSNPTGEPSGSGGTHIVLFIIVVLILASASGYLYWQLTQAQARVAVLEQRLSVTDESVNQSGVTIQVKIKELDAAISQMRDETLKRHQTLLEQHSAQLSTLDKANKNTQAALGKIDQRDADQQKALEGVQGQVEKVAPIVDASKRKIDEHQAALDATNDKLNKLTAQQGKLDARIGNNEEWVQSINTFRVQTNRELVNLKQQAVSGKAAAPAPEPIPQTPDAPPSPQVHAPAVIGPGAVVYNASFISGPVRLL